MVGSRIKHFRELNNLKREWLAEKLGIDASQINRIENNQSEVTVQRLYKIAQLFKISIVDLFEEEHLIAEPSNEIIKYGPIESSYIRYLIAQNEFLKNKYEELSITCNNLISTAEMQQVQFKRLMDFITENKSYTH